MKQSLIICFCFYFSCCNFSKNKSLPINEKLIGTWILDSIQKENTKIKYNDFYEISFIDNNTYSQKLVVGDVENFHTGKYFINENPIRGYKTITLIPNLVFYKTDTILLANTNLDISFKNDNEFLSHNPTEWNNSKKNKSINWFIKKK